MQSDRPHLNLKSRDYAGNCIINLTDLGLLKVMGPDAKRLLQGQLTCNLDDISPTASQFGAHCNPSGRIISLFRLFLYNDHYYLSMPKDLIPAAFKALNKYAPFYKVNLVDASQELISVGYCGLIEHLPAPHPVLIISIEAERHLILGETTRMTELWDKLTATHKVASSDYWQYCNIKAGIPTIYSDTSEKFLPHELNLPALNAVSFAKGCYTGQEIIARMHYRGKQKTRLETLTMTRTSMPVRHSDFTLPTGETGVIVDYCATDDNTYAILSILSQQK